MPHAPGTPAGRQAFARFFPDDPRLDPRLRLGDVRMILLLADILALIAQQQAPPVPA